jgi:GT2 family glycosyltransferase
MRWLPGMLETVLAQDLADWELLVLDNASTDGTAGWLDCQAAAEPRMRVVHSPVNLGFATGQDRLLHEARGRFVCLVNQDLQLDPGFLRHALAAFEGRPGVAAVQGRLRRLGPDGTRTDQLDSTGLVAHRDRRVVSRAGGQPDGPEHQVPGEVWGADGPSPVYRMSALMDARVPAEEGGWQVLDHRYFMYKEDVDLAWRLRLLGWSAWYTPDALAWHVRGAQGSPARGVRAWLDSRRMIRREVRMLSWANHRLMQVANEMPSMALRDLPWLVRREALSMGAMILLDPPMLRAVPRLLRGLPGALRKRRWVQRRRRVSADELRRWFRGDRPVR